MIVGLADAEPHVCKRPARALVHGAIAPLPKEFKCEEIQDLCSDMQMWLPPYIQCYGDLYKTEVFFPRPWLLAAKASPEHYTRQEAIKTAIDVIVEVARTYTIDDGDDLCDRIAKRRREIETDFIEGKEPDEAEYGIAPWTAETAF
ncbi:hypothetical protein EXIGLDRAFT_40086 [Exidia glandulosa HHB12029]|uniref:Uncharacterized protein n=1 Tax=Exidia glandulosa HHB12029 TaxID=1314781 RepID=A0A166ANC4_EXIGL|nr:hypothetical protein EXIGLDRAFT_40086 [Exidia glandulosa HHB12029]